MARLVNPVEARRGRFLKTFTSKRGIREMELPDEVAWFIEDLEQSQQKLNLPGEVVYTRMARWGERLGDTWQVYLLL
jgi:hypothetical protein